MRKKQRQRPTEPAHGSVGALRHGLRQAELQSLLRHAKNENNSILYTPLNSRPKRARSRTLPRCEAVTEQHSSLTVSKHERKNLRYHWGDQWDRA